MDIHRGAGTDEIELGLAFTGEYIDLDAGAAGDFIDSLLAVVSVAQRRRGKCIRLDIELFEQQVEVTQHLAGLVDAVRRHAPVQYIRCQSGSGFLCEDHAGLTVFTLIDVEMHGVGADINNAVHNTFLLSALICLYYNPKATLVDYVFIKVFEKGVLF